MGLDFCIGEKFWEVDETDEDEGGHWHIKSVETDKLPSPINRNRYLMNINGVGKFFRQYDLLEIYGSVRNNPDGEFTSVTKWHVGIFEDRLAKFKVKYLFSELDEFCWCKARNSPGKIKCRCNIQIMQDKKQDLQRLTWFSYWSNWALQEVKEPYFKVW